MAKIRNSKPKTSSGGYNRVFNNTSLGELIQKVQSTVISNGNELETMILSNSNVIENLDQFLSMDDKKGVFLCPKKVIKNSKYKLKEHEPDLVIFEISENNRNCYIIELKDGDNFDTKKSLGEFESLEQYKNHLGSQITFITNFFICSFNQNDKELIVKGFKNVFNINQVMTGRELCDLLKINYDKIIEKRKQDAEDNKKYFTEELVKIPFIINEIFLAKNSHIQEDDFYN